MTSLTKKQLVNGITLSRVNWSKYDISQCSKASLLRLPKPVLQDMHTNERSSLFRIPDHLPDGQVYKRNLNVLNAMDIVHIKSLTLKLELCAYFQILSRALREIPVVNFPFYDAWANNALYTSRTAVTYTSIHMVNFKSFYDDLSEHTGLYDLVMVSGCDSFTRRDVMTHITYLHKNRINSLIAAIFKLKVSLHKLK